MAKRRQKAADTKPVPTIPQAELAAIRKALQRAELAEAESKAAAAAARLVIAKQLEKLDMPIQTSAVCLECGAVHPANGPCPKCSKQEPHRTPR